MKIKRRMRQIWVGGMTSSKKRSRRGGELMGSMSWQYVSLVSEIGSRKGEEIIRTHEMRERTTEPERQHCNDVCVY